jgi:hypothetical protein
MDQWGSLASVMSKSSGIAKTEIKKEYWNACGGVLGSSSGAGVIKTVVTQTAATTAVMQTTILRIGLGLIMSLRTIDARSACRLHPSQILSEFVLQRLC